MQGMTLRDEVAQLVFIPFPGEFTNTRSRAYRKFVRLVSQARVGGLVINNTAGPKVEARRVAAFLNRMQQLARVPLLVGGDFERGASMRIDGTTVFPHAMAFGAAGDPALARYEGVVTAREARALGVHWVFFPVADVNNNPENPIINTRSFGEDPNTVAAMVKAFIEGAHWSDAGYVLTTAKHFPGHGDTAVDSHMGLPTIPADRARLDALELMPFRAAIAAGVDSIMTAHIAVPALAPPDLPATLSPAILTGLLRNDLGFKGLVVTDALEMAGDAKGYSVGEASVRALEAGADTLLMPGDPDQAISAVVAAVQSGRLSRERIRQSVARILAAKEKVGLHRARTVPLDAIGSLVNTAESNRKAGEIASRALTLVHNANNVVPLAAPERACYVVMPSSRNSAQGQAFADEVRHRAPSAVIATLDPSMTRQQVDSQLATFSSCPSFVVAAFAPVGANRGSVGLLGELPYAMQALSGLRKPVVLVALGSPYLFRNFPNVDGYLATFSTVPPSEVAAVRALWGEIAIQGHLPVTIPGLAKLGDGIMLAAIRPGASR